jgi:O-antigen/teichoic acid export membrane protein
MDPERAHKITNFLNNIADAIRGGLVKQILAFGGMSLLAALLLMLFHVYASRMLGPEGYGELGVLLSLISALLILLSSIYLIINKFMVQYAARGQEENIKFLIKLSFWDSFLLGFASFVLCIFLSEIIADFFHMKNSTTVVFFGLLVWVTFLTPVLEGIFKGMQSFQLVGIFKMFESASRVLILVIFMWLGLGVNGAILALAIGTLVGISFCIKPLYRFRNTNSNRIYLSEFYRFAVPVILGSLFITLILSIDVILVKHFFNPQEAGYFAAAGTLARIPFLIAVALGGVMFSKVAQNFNEGKQTRSALQNAIIYLGIIDVVFLAIIYFYSKQVAHAIFGSQYQVAGFLFWYVLAFVLFSFVNIIALYEFARKRYKLLFVLIIGFLAEFVLLLFFHFALVQVVIIICAVMISMFVAVVGYEKNEIL